jgi:hypothetical protein
LNRVGTVGHVAAWRHKAPNALNCGFGAQHGVLADAMSSARMAIKFEL